MFSAFSAFAAVTDPVGAQSITVKGQSDTFLSIPFTRSVEFEGVVDSVSGSSVTLLGASFTANQFVPGNVANENPGESYFVVFMSGTLEGQAFVVSSNTASSTTLNLNGGSLASVATEQVDGTGLGDIVQISLCWTPASLFAGVTLPNQISISLFDSSSSGVFKSPSVLTFFSGSGWFDGGFASADKLPILPSQGFMVRTPPASSDFSLVLYGGVPMHAAGIRIPGSTSTSTDIHLGIYSPIDATVLGSNLGVVDQTQLLVYDNSVAQYFKSPTVYTYFNGVGWFDGGFASADANLIPSGAYVILRTPATGSGNDINWNYLPAYLQ